MCVTCFCFAVSSMELDSQYRRCTVSADSADTCVVDRVFDRAAADRVMHIKVTGSFGACTCQDELVIQLSRIGECLVIRAQCWGVFKYYLYLNIKLCKKVFELSI